MQYSEILDQLPAYVVSLFHANKDDRFAYHNLEHTEQVVQNAVKIATHYQLSDHDYFVVVAASWFHDMGYLFDCNQHEDRGAQMAINFLGEKGVDQETVEQVRGCILATKMPQNPLGLLQEIVCDADLFHLGSDSFKEKNKLMRKEAEAFCNKTLQKNDWRIRTIALFKAHHYHTDYCRDLLDDKKAQNLADMEGKSNKTNTKKDVEKPRRGVETMFRISSANHQRLSDMADNKAHIMISTNAIILSVILSLLLRKLEDNPHLIIPTLLLLIICVVTMVFSILATRPSIPEGIFTQKDIDEKKVNLLFFGNFYRTSLSDYQNGMLKMMDDKEFLYGSLIKDVYAQGVVLGRKYRLLRVAYNVFMYGIVAAVLAFIIAAALVAL